MSNPRPALFQQRWWLLLIALGSGAASSQDKPLLDAVRMHRPEAARLAREQLEACQHPELVPGKKPATCPDERRLSLLLGVLLTSDGDPAAGAAQLLKVKPPRGLEPFHAWYLGEAQSWSGARAQALKSFEKAKKDAPAWLTRRIDARVAEVQLALGKVDQARPALEAAATDDPSAETLYPLSIAKWMQGEKEAARADWRTIALRFPAHPHAALARDLLERRGTPPVWTPEERFRLAQAWLVAGEPGKTLKFLEDLELVGKGAAARVQLVRGQAFLARGRDAEAAKALESAAAEGTPNVAADALLTLARRQMRLGDNAGAREVFDRLEARFPNLAAAEEGAYFGGWISLHAGQFDEAARRLAAYEQKHPASRRRDEARWFRAYALFRAERYLESRAALQTLIADFPRSSLVPQARYWAARCAQLDTPAPDAGPRPDAAAELRQLVLESPGTFYALLARERLLDLGLDAPAIFDLKPRRLPAKPPPVLALATELARAGLFRDAAEETQRAVSQAGGPEDAMSWGHALQALEEFGPAYTLGARHLWGAVYTQRQPEAVALLYPRAWQAAVEDAAQDRGLDPFFAWAIMRRESAFRPEVTSSADARGLMQIIPPTAVSIAASLKETPPAPGDLYSPSLNVRYGTWYLAALLDRVHHPALAAASYNAGPGAVVKWVAQHGDRPLDEFVEEIPYKETRGYVKQVMADLFIYRQLYGDGPAPRLAMKLPPPKASGVTF